MHIIGDVWNGTRLLGELMRCKHKAKAPQCYVKRSLLAFFTNYFILRPCISLLCSINSKVQTDARTSYRADHNTWQGMPHVCHLSWMDKENPELRFIVRCVKLSLFYKPKSLQWLQWWWIRSWQYECWLWFSISKLSHLPYTYNVTNIYRFPENSRLPQVEKANKYSNK